MGSVSIAHRTNASGDLVNWLGDEIDGLSLPGDERHRIAGACLRVSLDHHAAIASLIHDRRFAPAFALLRPQIDAFLRALWVAHCATDIELRNVKEGGDPPGSRQIAEKLEEVGCFTPSLLTSIRGRIWPALSDFTHCGIRTIVGHLSASGISPAFSDAEVIEILDASDAWAVMTGIGIASLADDAELGVRISEMGKKVRAKK